MKAISLVINPLLMPTLMFGTIFYFAPEAAQPFNLDQAIYLMLLIALMTFLIPLFGLGAYVIKTFGTENFWLNDREDRVIPFFLTTIFYAITAYMFIERLRVNGYLTVILITSASMVLSVALITMFWKISVHSTALSGLVGFILGLALKLPSADLLYPLIASILITGLVMTARLALNAHTPRQILGGAILGFGMALGSILLFT